MFIEIDHRLSQQNSDAMKTEEHAQMPDCSSNLSKHDEAESFLNSVRQKFGLKPVVTQVEDSIENLFDETNIIQGALEIKLESEAGDYEVAEQYSDDQDFSESSEEDEEEEEDESDIEELSDSQLRKHEDSLQFKDESSESGREGRKCRRRKYRKSSEEKLFE